MPIATGAVLAHNVLHCQTLFERFLVGFTDDTRTRQAPALPNHVAWTLGHLGLTARRCAERVGGRDEPGALPPVDFVMGDRGDARRFGIESVAFASTPTDDADRYPSLKRSLEIMRDAHAALADALRAAGDEALARETPWGAGRTTVSDLALRMGFHIGTHAGQIVDLRRALGLGPALARPPAR